MIGKEIVKEAKPSALVANDPDVCKGKLRDTGGSRSDVWNTIVADQTIEALWKHSDPEMRDKQFEATVAALAGIGPKDELEGMMAAQLIAAHKDPVPLCLSPSDCPWRPPWKDDCYWRSAALRTLERAGRPYRLVASASSMEALYAPVAAGEAITVSIGAKLPAGLRVVTDEEGLPPLPDSSVVIIKARNAIQPLTDVLTGIILSTFSIS